MDVVEMYLNYKKYNHNIINIIIHLITVPLIFTTISIIITLFQDYLIIFLSILYMIYYFYLDFMIGIIMIPFIMINYYLTYIICYHEKESNIVSDNKFIINNAFLYNIISWVIYSLTIIIFESSHPNLLKNIYDVFLIGPIFCIIDAAEILFDIDLLEKRN